MRVADRDRHERREAGVFARSAVDIPVWEFADCRNTGEPQRIAAELLRKLGVSLSPRTVRRYRRRPPSTHSGLRTQTWSTFVRNHAHDVFACDFFVTVTARFRLLYVFVLLDAATRRLVHWNVTAHSTAEWAVQQFRTGVTGETTHRFLVHDRDSIYSPTVDDSLRAMGLRVLKTPIMAPQANAYCERVIGTARRDCLDWVIPVDERHLRRVLTEWVAHHITDDRMRRSARVCRTARRRSWYPVPGTTCHEPVG